MIRNRPFEAQILSFNGMATEGKGGYSTNFYTGRLCPEVQPLTLLYTIFSRKRCPSFIYLPVDKWYLF